MIISDEIYGLVSFDRQYRSISKYAPDNTLVTTGLSKHMSLGGWRMGLAIVPKTLKGLTPLIQSIASETWSCVPSPMQYAVLDAYKRHEDVEQYIKDCAEIHGFINTYIAEGLRRIGITCALPQGAFYVYPDFDPYRETLLQKGVKTSKIWLITCLRLMALYPFRGLLLVRNLRCLPCACRAVIMMARKCCRLSGRGKS